MSETVRDYPVVTEINVRFRDLDAMGHVNNAVYLTYFEESRVEYFRALSRGSGIAPEDMEFVVAEIKCVYHSPAMLQERLLVGIRASQVGNKSFRFEYRIEEKETGRLVASGYSVQGSYDYSARRSVPLPKELLEGIRQLQGSVPRRTNDGTRS